MKLKLTFLLCLLSCTGIAQNQLTLLPSSSKTTMPGLIESKEFNNSVAFLVDNEGSVELWDYTQHSKLRKLATLFAKPERKSYAPLSWVFDQYEGEYLIKYNGAGYPYNETTYLIDTLGKVEMVYGLSLAETYAILDDQILDGRLARDSSFYITRWNLKDGILDTLVNFAGPPYVYSNLIRVVNDSLVFITISDGNYGGKSYMYNIIRDSLFELLYDSDSFYAYDIIPTERGIYLDAGPSKPSQRQYSEHSIFSYLGKNKVSKNITIKSVSSSDVKSNNDLTTIAYKHSLEDWVTVYANTGKWYSFEEAATLKGLRSIDYKLLNPNLVYYQTDGNSGMLFNIKTQEKLYLTRFAKSVGEYIVANGDTINYFVDNRYNHLLRSDGTKTGTYFLNTFPTGTKYLAVSMRESCAFLTVYYDSLPTQYYWIKGDSLVKLQIPFSGQVYISDLNDSTALLWQIAGQHYGNDSFTDTCRFAQISYGDSVPSSVDHKPLHAYKASRRGYSPHKIMLADSHLYYIDSNEIKYSRGTINQTFNIDTASLKEHFVILKEHKGEFYKFNMAVNNAYQQVQKIGSNGFDVSTIDSFGEGSHRDWLIEFDYVTHAITDEGFYSTVDKYGHVVFMDMQGDTSTIDASNSNCVYHTSKNKVYYHDVYSHESKVYDERTKQIKVTSKGYVHLVHISNCFENQDSVLVFTRESKSGEYGLYLQTADTIKFIANSQGLQSTLMDDWAVILQHGIRVRNKVYLHANSTNGVGVYVLDLLSLIIQPLVSGNNRITHILGNFEKDSTILALGKWQNGSIPVYRIVKGGTPIVITYIKDPELKNYNNWLATPVQKEYATEGRQLFLPYFTAGSGNEIGLFYLDSNRLDVLFDHQSGSLSSEPKHMRIKNDYLFYTALDTNQTRQLYSLHLYQPVYSFGVEGNCVNDSFQFASKSMVPLGKVTNTTWSIEGGATTNSPDFKYRFDSAGTYWVEHVIKDQNGIEYRDSVYVTANGNAFELLGSDRVYQDSTYSYFGSDTTMKYHFSVGNAGIITWADSSSAKVAWKDSTKSGRYIKAEVLNQECGSSDSINVVFAQVVAVRSSFDQFKLFPNPFSDHLIIEKPDERFAKIRIYQMDGKLVFEQNLIGQSNELALAHLSPGAYHVKVSGLSGTRVFKVIK